MRFHALIGVLAHERELAQPLEVDVTVQLESSMRGDRPALDYRTLYAAVAAVVAAGPLDYLERAAERIAAAVLALDGVTEVRAAVRKPHVGVGGSLAYAEAAVERTAAFAGGSADA